MKTLTKSIKEKYNLDDNYNLVFVDYRDSFDDNPEMIEKILQNKDNFWEENNDWIPDSQMSTVSEFINSLKEEHGEIPDEDINEIRDYLYEHDDSDPLHDLLRNTSSQYFYYSLGFEIENHDAHVLCPKGCIEKQISKIMKALKTNDPETRKSVSEVICNAGYGGDVVILFEEKLENLLHDNDVIEFGPKAEICVMDRVNGSGWSAPLNRKIVVKFKRENLHCDKGMPGYSFTSDVCGLTKGFMDGASIRRKKKSDKVIPAKLNTEEKYRREREKEFERKWREEHKCSFGDIKFSRHENVEYRNDYPCGHKCLDCGHFWID